MKHLKRFFRRTQRSAQRGPNGAKPANAGERGPNGAKLANASERGPNGAKLANASERGMTLLEIMIVLAILALVMGLVVGPRVMKMFGESKVDIARATVKKYAFEAYPSWSQSHPDKSCPDKLEDLNEYMNNKDIKDPWGGTYKMLCGANVPAGAKGLAVSSAGEDGKEGTDDDVKSW